MVIRTKIIEIILRVLFETLCHSFVLFDKPLGESLSSIIMVVFFVCCSGQFEQGFELAETWSLYAYMLNLASRTTAVAVSPLVPHVRSTRCGFKNEIMCRYREMLMASCEIRFLSGCIERCC